MAENNVSMDGRSGRGRPTALEPYCKQLIGRRPMIPDGDRRHHAKSGRVIDQP